jgi:ribonuclease BN (tRNA processing enzyme)
LHRRCRLVRTAWQLSARLLFPGRFLMTDNHTTTEQLAELANKAKPKLLVIYHTITFPPGIAPPRLLPPNAGADAL